MAGVNLLSIRPVQSCTVRWSSPTYAHDMMPTDRTDAEERLARIEQMIDEYRGMKQRQLLQQAMSLWRKAEAREQFMQLDERPERVH